MSSSGAPRTPALNRRLVLASTASEAQKLLQLGADLHAHSDRALRVAVANNNAEVAAALLEAGADPNAWSDDPPKFDDDPAVTDSATVPMYNALVAAATLNSALLVRLCLKHGATVDRRRRGAWWFAERRGYGEVLALLEQAEGAPDKTAPVTGTQPVAVASSSSDASGEPVPRSSDKKPKAARSTATLAAQERSLAKRSGTATSATLRLFGEGQQLSGAVVADALTASERFVDAGMKMAVGVAGVGTEGALRLAGTGLVQASRAVDARMEAKAGVKVGTTGTRPATRSAARAGLLEQLETAVADGNVAAVNSILSDARIRPLGDGLLEDALYTACIHGHAAVVRRLIEAGADVANDSGGDSFLCAACEKGHTAVVEELLTAGADVDDAQGKPLCDASEKGFADIVDRLVVAGADIDIKNGYPLLAACRNNYTDVAERLIRAGANVHAEDDEALCYASENGNTNIVRRLVAAGADIEAADGLPLRGASNGGHIDVMRLLLAAGADVHADHGRALCWACAAGQFEAIDVLIGAGADVDEAGGGPLVSAVRTGRIPVVQRLLEIGASVHASEDSALRTACTRQEEGLVKVLLAAGADVHARDDEAISLRSWGTLRFTSLEEHKAFQNGTSDKARAIIELLLKAGANPAKVPPGYEFRGDIMPFLTREQAKQLPNGVKKLWVDANMRPRLRLQQALQRARNRLDRPPTVRLGTPTPTREHMITLLLTAGKRFARDYWVDGIPIFEPGADYGELPEDFKEIEITTTNAPPIVLPGDTLEAAPGDTLEAASMGGDLKRVQQLLKEGADVHANEDGALRAASISGNKQIISRLLDAGANGPLVVAQSEEWELAAGKSAGPAANETEGGATVTTTKGRTGAPGDRVPGEGQADARSPLVQLCDASKLGNAAVVGQLLDTGTFTALQLHEPLRAACESGSLEVVRRLLKAGAKVYKQDGALETPLEKAVINGDPEILRALLASEVDPSFHSQLGEALREACIRGSVHSVEMLLGAGAGVHYREDRPLIEASSRGFKDIVVMLIAARADVGARGDSALAGACFYGHPSVVDVLIKAGANVNAHGGEILASERTLQNPHVVKLLLDAGADATAHDGAALKTAAIAWEPEVIMLLLGAGAPGADFALQRATQRGDAEVTNAAIAAGADIHADSDEALIRASERGHTETARVLLDKGADIHAQDDLALILACESAKTETVGLLIARGANVNARDGGAMEECVSRIRNMGTFEGRLRGKPDEACRQIIVMLLEAGADPSKLPNDFQMDARIIAFLGSKQAQSLSDDAKRLYMGVNVRPRLRLGKLGHNASDRLDHPPTAHLGTQKPTREQLVTLLMTAGKRFAREYWLEGVPIFLPGVDMGPLPDEFSERPVGGNPRNDGGGSNGEARPPTTNGCGAPKTGAPPHQRMKAKVGITGTRPVEGSKEHTDLRKELPVAIEKGDTERVRFIVDRLHPASLGELHQMSVLALRACVNDHVDIVTILLAAGADVNYNNGRALRYASAHGFTTMIERLLSAGADVHAKNDESICVASESGHLAVVQALLAAGADVDAADGEPLIRAIYNSHVDVANHLITAGASIHVQNDQPLRSASFRGLTELVRRLLSLGANVNVDDDNPLRFACIHGYAGVVRVLLTGGANVHALGGEPLIDASQRGNVDVIDVLLAAGANVHARNDAPLVVASEFGQEAAVIRLLAAGASIHATDDQALRLACKNEHLGVVGILLEAGANVHANNDAAITLGGDCYFEPTPKNGELRFGKWSPHRKLTDKSRAVVELLLKAGANPAKVPTGYEFQGDTMTFLTREQATQLSDDAKKRWIDVNARPRIKLGSSTLNAALRRARDRLDHPPTMRLGTSKPTREHLITQLSTAGKRFAREYWLDGASIFLPEADLGELPDEFRERHVGVNQGPVPTTGAPPHRPQSDGLAMECWRGNLARVKQLLKEGAYIHEDGEAPLLWACREENIDVIKELIKAGANVHADEDAALRYASQKGHTAVVKLLLEAEADVHAKRDWSLLWACTYGHAEVVYLLIKAGADVHARDDEALRRAAGSGQRKAIERLLEAGANGPLVLTQFEELNGQNQASAKPISV